AWMKSARTVTTSTSSVRSVLRAASRFSSLREAIDTSAPSAANARAHARPMPLLPPVMRTTLRSSPSFMRLPPVEAVYDRRKCSTLQRNASAGDGLRFDSTSNFEVFDLPEEWIHPVEALYD